MELIPTGTAVYLLIYALFDIGLETTFFLWFFEPKRPKKRSCVLYIALLFLWNAESMYTTIYLPYEDHFFNSAGYEIISSLIFFALFLLVLQLCAKGNPVRSFAIWQLLDYASLPALFLCSLIRKLAGWPSPMESVTISDFPDCACTFIAYLLTALLLKRFAARWEKKLQRMPLFIAWIILLFENASALLSITDLNTPDYFIGGISATLNIGMALFLLSFILALLIAIALSIASARAAEQTSRLVQAQLELQHNYYASMSKTQTMLRGLRHDLANHLSVLSALKESGREEKLRQYEDSLLDFCTRIEEQAAPDPKWENWKLPGLTPQEHHAFCSALERLLQHPGIPEHAARVCRNMDSLEILFSKNQISKRTLRRIKKDIYWEVISQISNRHQIHPHWKEGDDQWEFILNF
ncbi:hypothetical protein [Zhenpiania hominis]|uniref:hypothetical protein n=1 Tax=Zhenpiania hominis TaxID=2763644 RepID=UPI0039F5D3F2